MIAMARRELGKAQPGLVILSSSEKSDRASFIRRSKRTRSLLSGIAEWLRKWRFFGRARERITSPVDAQPSSRSEEHTSELQSLTNLVCRLLLEKKKNIMEYVLKFKFGQQ